MFRVITDRLFTAVPLQPPGCRCGNPAIDEEACHVCEQMVCASCAAFIDPRSRRQERPSHLLARGITRNFLAHHACLGDTSPRMTSMLETRDVPHLVRILRQQTGATEAGRPLRGARSAVQVDRLQRVAPAFVRISRD
ncbi:MAG: hypothetical protein VKP72_07810 [bacterium]|nr:hypothetical protein [bacterium]